MKTEAMLTTKTNTFEKTKLELNEIQDDEILVKIVASGVCHTDATVINDEMPTPKPVVLGHEGAGIVEKVGSHVKTLQSGDHVVLSFSYCGHCDNCLEGKSGACENMTQLNFSGKNEDGETPIHSENGEAISQFFGQSSFAQYAVVKETNAVKVPNDVDLRYIAPLGCGFMTGSGTVLNALNPRAGSSIAIFGTGAVGLSAIMAAKVAGCTTIIAVDIHDSRLELAKEVGATHVINSKNVVADEKIKDITGKGVRYAVETTGVPEVVLSSIRSLSVSGECATVGVGSKELSINITEEIMVPGKTLRGVIEGNSNPHIMIPKLVEFFKQGIFPIDKLIKFYNFDSISKAFEDSKNGQTIKPVLVIDETYEA
ncbi:NAD(P)-dependent alcohol dehydrogenase [Staphylococcus carnosus]|uniref:Aryl-alcohol dehydrogenase n=2 Tax=Staphylococcus carnosus TaxID=1281 RepID=A0AAJ0JPP3_STACA|nr:NAD(P)-dependent alcohol dehydrogenase [Staphylococcus carnosus]KKB25521.1 aryl-alcohol dehydrogenase [Staphylococcus carnosus]QQS86310.1 NAD(P)-dependent alcohol dehydrogenase [Staphylococcus carnosus]QRQ06272.1 NAD(P)-dependent alcohol dehydrogenase [Staphylococcus carnosus]UTB84009.1 aryl-alcohol dehydrogenase [Staphylococcus carnosus]UTB99324.1 aryl-alcohol dehydrogenase [Staphylococcus carnosus]